METVSAVIVAGGSGSRFGQKKQFITLGGTPILALTAACFDAHPGIDHIVVVVPPADVTAAEKLLHTLTTRHTVTAGGPTRADSVRNGLNEAAQSRICLIHDGVRPFVNPSLIHRVLAGIEGYDACIPGLPVTDTIKEVVGHNVAKTIPRRNVYQIQTPQAFFTARILDAHRQAAGRTDAPTDDSMLIEAAGGTVRLVDGDPYNIKITLPEDMLFAEAIHALQDRNRI